MFVSQSVLEMHVHAYVVFMGSSDADVCSLAPAGTQGPKLAAYSKPKGKRWMKMALHHDCHETQGGGGQEG